MQHPLVEMACREFYHKSHIDEPLITGEASLPEEKNFKE